MTATLASCLPLRNSQDRVKIPVVPLVFVAGHLPSRSSEATRDISRPVPPEQPTAVDDVDPAQPGSSARPYWAVALSLGVLVFAGQVIERSLSAR